MSMKWRAGLVLLLAAAGATTVFYFLRNVPNPHTKACARLTAIAQDSQKMKYARDWAVSRLSNDKFMAAVRESKSFERTIPSQAQYIDLNWRYLGFLGPARIEFNFKVADWDTLEARKVGSVS